MEAALELEKKVNKSLLDLHKVADCHGDFQVRNMPTLIDCSLIEEEVKGCVPFILVSPL